MDANSKEIARNLFSTMTMMLEDSTLIAAKGQSSKLTGMACRRLSYQIRDVAAHLRRLSKVTLSLSAKP